MSTIDSPRKGAVDALRTAIGVGGIVALVVGVLILVWPGKTAMVVTAIVGIYLILVGLGFVGSAIFGTARSGWGRLGHLLLGVLYVVAGVLALVDLAAATVSLAIFLAILVGIMWVFEGFVALTTLGFTRSRVWTVVFALLSIVAGVLLFLSPLWGAATLWWLLGISLVVLGVTQIVRALTWRPSVD